MNKGTQQELTKRAYIRRSFFRLMAASGGAVAYLPLVDYDRVANNQQAQYMIDAWDRSTLSAFYDRTQLVLGTNYFNPELGKHKLEIKGDYKNIKAVKTWNATTVNFLPLEKLTEVETLHFQYQTSLTPVAISDFTHLTRLKDFYATHYNIAELHLANVPLCNINYRHGQIAHTITGTIRSAYILCHSQLTTTIDFGRLSVEVIRIGDLKDYQFITLPTDHLRLTHINLDSTFANTHKTLDFRAYSNLVILRQLFGYAAQWEVIIDNPNLQRLEVQNMKTLSWTANTTNLLRLDAYNQSKVWLNAANLQSTLPLFKQNLKVDFWRIQNANLTEAEIMDFLNHLNLNRATYTAAAITMDFTIQSQHDGSGNRGISQLAHYDTCNQLSTKGVTVQLAPLAYTTHYIDGLTLRLSYFHEEIPNVFAAGGTITITAIQHNTANIIGAGTYTILSVSGKDVVIDYVNTITATAGQKLSHVQCKR